MSARLMLYRGLYIFAKGRRIEILGGRTYEQISARASRVKGPFLLQLR